MPLRKQLIEAPLSAGLNQKSDSRSLQVDGAISMTNCVRTKSGAIRKRVGCQGLINMVQANTTSLGASFTFNEFNVVRGVNYGRGPLIFDGYTFSEYSESNPQWTLLDSTPEAVATNRLPLAGLGTATVFGGVGVIAGADLDYYPTRNLYVCVAIGASGSLNSVIMATITDAINGAIVFPTTIISAAGTTGSIPKVVICGNIAVAAWINTTTSELTISKLDLTNIPAGWGVPVVYAPGNVSTFDMMPVVGDSTRVVIGYINAINVVLASVLVSNLTTTHSTSNAITTPPNQPITIAVYATNTEEFWCAYRTYNASIPNVTTFAFGYRDVNPFTATVLITVVTVSGSVVGGMMGIVRVGVGEMVLIWSQPEFFSSPFEPCIYGQQITTAGGGATNGPLRKTYGVILYSKPLLVTTPVGTRCYALVGTSSALQGTQALVCFDFVGSLATFGSQTASDVPARLVATLSPRLTKIFNNSVGHNISPLSAAKIVAPTASTIATISYINTSLTQAGLFIQPFDFASQLQYFGDALSGSTLLGLSAGAPFTFDGQMPAEMGFLWYPDSANISTTFGAGALVGAYSYIITYEWIDAAGNTHRSATSPPINVSPATQSVNLILPVMGVTWRMRHAPAVALGHNIFQNAAANVKVNIYRTIASGTIYYFVAAVDNVTNVPTITYNDNATDASISGANAKLLYTTGGLLDNFCPASARIAVVHKNRWFLSGCDDPTVIWPSKAFTSGEVPGFNEVFNFYATGAVTALASLDEKLIIFVKRGAQYGLEYIVGEGPLDTGASNDWTNPPQPIPSSAGAIDQRSIAVTEIGCVFMSPVGAPNGGGGIFLLSRDLQIHYLSGPVEDIIALNPVCTGVVVHPNAGRIYFEMAPTDSMTISTTGIRLVYDYIMQCWSTDTHFGFPTSLNNAAARTTWVASGAGLTAAGTSVNMPLVHWADFSGLVYRETTGISATGAYVDTAFSGARHWITASFTSAWFKPSLAGFARFWRVQLQSDSFDAASLAMSFQFDYAPSSYYSEAATFTDTQIATFDRNPQIDVEHLVGNQKAKAIQVTLIDSPPLAGYTIGQGFQWASISIEVGIEDGGRYVNLPTGQRS